MRLAIYHILVGIIPSAFDPKHLKHFITTKRTILLVVRFGGATDLFNRKIHLS